MTEQPTRRSAAGELTRELQLAAAELEQDVRRLLESVHLTPDVAELNGIAIAKLRMHRDGEYIFRDAGEEAESMNRVAALHEASKPWPVEAVDLIVMSHILLKDARSMKPGPESLRALLTITRQIGFAQAEIEGVYPRSLRIAREQLEAVRKAEELQAASFAAWTRSDQGREGARKRHDNSPVSKLKDWARETAKGLRGSDKQKARKLRLMIPPELEDASQDPEGTIYKALLAESKAKHTN